MDRHTLVVCDSRLRDADVTGELIQAWADEAAKAYDVAARPFLRPRTGCTCDVGAASPSAPALAWAQHHRRCAGRTGGHAPRTEAKELP